jgi:glycosidase
MSFSDTLLGQNRPSSIRTVSLPRRQHFYASPADWRNEVLYFLLPDRFSDGQEANRQPLPLDAEKRAALRTDKWQWNKWTESGGDRWQGGTLKGIISKLDYLHNLGVTAIWLGPIFKQRGHLNTFHGYGIQDFLEVDPRFGNRQDLVDLVAAAHNKQMRVILDIIFNHSGNNWIYEEVEPGNDPNKPPYRPWPDFYHKRKWRGIDGNPVDNIVKNEDGVWPQELQADNCYTRAGTGSLGSGSLDDDQAEFRRTDFEDLRDFNFDDRDTLDNLARCYKYWIALTDCDGFRIDTLKHVPWEAARNFCGTIKEFANNLGKVNFFLVGEVAGSDDDAGKYLDALELNLNATLDIGWMRRQLHAVAKGLVKPNAYFDIVKQWQPILGSHRNSGPRHVSILDDHDHVSGDKIRFSSDAASDHQVVAGVAIQLFSLGIPCIYYGTEQAFAGPEKSKRNWLDNYGGSDRYLREAMFGPAHPRRSGKDGLPSEADGLDPNLPGFGPFGSAGYHCFNEQHPAYLRIAALLKVRQEYPVLRYGRQYLRPISNFGGDFVESEAGEIIAWSRILDDEEALCIVNSHGTQARGGDVMVDAKLNIEEGSKFQVIANSAQAVEKDTYKGTHPIGTTVDVKQRSGKRFVEIRDVPPSEVLILINRP